MRARVERQAVDNARAMARFGARASLDLPGQAYRGRHAFTGKPALSASVPKPAAATARNLRRLTRRRKFSFSMCRTPLC